MSLLQRARNSGRCPPSLLSEERVVNEDGFDATVIRVADPSGFFLSSDPNIRQDFEAVMEMCASISRIPGSGSDLMKRKVLEYRRCIVLALVAGTPTESTVLARIIEGGFLSSVKSWLDHILASEEGGIDMLLHLLSSLVHLPVTKSTVKDSTMGKAIGSIEKHRICKGTLNEASIKDRVSQIKSAWQASVKARKIPSSEEGGTKRSLEDDTSDATPPKRPKAEAEPKKASSFSSLLKKMSKTSQETGGVPRKAQTSAGTPVPSIDKAGIEEILAQTRAQAEKAAGASKKSALRVKWADHFGGKISVAQVGGGGENDEESAVGKAMSWGDRKKRDRLREKELLANAKKSKLIDEDEDMDLPKAITATTTWRVPMLLPERTDATLAQLSSREVSLQNERMKTVTAASYLSSFNVPASPTPLSDVEQALDMTSQSSAKIASIPFFVPQQAIPEASPAATPAIVGTAALTQQPQTYGVPSQPAIGATATTDFVQGLGLPLFLVGQPVHALQSLANSPGLLSALVDGNGVYDQPRLMSLVHTLSASTTASTTHGAPATYQPPPPANPYGAAASASIYGHSPSFSARPPQSGGFRSTKSDEGNLHVSGYGPTTTEAEIIACFAPYVRVDEVVMKSTFSFVNTSDPVNAQRAREALTGTLVGGMPVRINPATRKNRDNNMSQYGGGASIARPPVPPSFSSQSGTTSFATNSSFPGGFSAAGAGTPAGVSSAQTNVDAVRDDRGNPATKNLFIAGYGQGTTEHQLRDVVAQYAQVTGVVVKGTFSFVNTTDRAAAVMAREMLSGTMLNGGQLRINFAKETGRLGTSFDVTYGGTVVPGAPNARPGPPPAAMSYYGRGGY